MFPSLFPAFVLAGFSPLLSDWFVDRNAPGCPAGSGTPLDPFCSIGEAIASAASGDTIFVAAGTYPELLLLDRDLTLVGSSGASVTVVDGQALGSTVQVLGGALVAIDALTIEGGQAFVGGGIHNAGDLTLRNSSVSGNSASFAAGIYSTPASSLAVEDSLIVANLAATTAGGVLATTPAVCLTNVTLSGNQAGSAAAALLLQAGGSMRDSIICQNEGYYYSAASSPGVIRFSGSLSMTGCQVDGNRGGGIGCSAGGTLTLSHSTVSNNLWASGVDIEPTAAASLFASTIAGNSTPYGKSGAGIDNRGVLTATQCSIRDNATFYGSGGGLENRGSSQATLILTEIAGNSDDGILNSGDLLLSGCAVVGNTCDGYGSPQPAGIVNRRQPGHPLPTLTLSACTVSGRLLNPALSGGTVSLDHTIVGGSSTPGLAAECSGTLESLGYNLIEDSSGCNLIGDLVGNLLDVDPGFVDDVAGDFRLQATSPAVDAGKVTLRPCEGDLFGGSRLIDGDLDRVMVVDLGALEFAHARLTVVGPAVEGQPLTILVDGTAGLLTFLFVGTGSGAALFPPYGCLLVNLAGPSAIANVGNTPVSITAPLPAGTSGITLALQAIVLSGASGQLTNLQEFQVE